MNQREFVERYQASWVRYEELLEDLCSPTHKSAERTRMLAEFPHLYRRLAQQLALARERSYSPALVARLNALLLRGHRQLHRARPVSVERITRFLLFDFPRQLRRDARTFRLAAALLFLPGLAVAAAAAWDADLLYAILPPQQAAQYEAMYDPASSHFGKERDSDSDFLMFGYYVRNNISVGFQTFAGGLLLGLGSVFYLVFNGMFFGAVAAHLSAVGFGATFSAFVITHGAFELTAIAVAGTAGLKLGSALLAPGRRTRLGALKLAARESATLVLGMTAMLLVAAFVEAFWSSSATVPDAVKYGVGAACWALVGAWLLLAGRSDGPR